MTESKLEERTKNWINLHLNRKFKSTQNDKFISITLAWLLCSRDAMCRSCFGCNQENLVWFYTGTLLIILVCALRLIQQKMKRKKTIWFLILNGIKTDPCAVHSNVSDTDKEERHKKKHRERTASSSFVGNVKCGVERRLLVRGIFYLSLPTGRRRGGMEERWNKTPSKQTNKQEHRTKNLHKRIMYYFSNINTALTQMPAVQ